VHIPSGEQMSIYDRRDALQAGRHITDHPGRPRNTAPARLATGAAKGTMLLGVKAVIAESFERIHRSNLIGMGVLPLQFLPGPERATAGTQGHRKPSRSPAAAMPRARPSQSRQRRQVVAKPVEFEARVRIDTPKERDYYRHGGILHYVLRQLASAGRAAA